jgi:DNA repair protein RecO (recombination protein O)
MFTVASVPMPARESESLILRTYPFREADLIVSFLARDQGRLRGVARGARRPKSRFGAGLERLAHVRLFYFQRETRDLVSLDSCELIESHFGVLADFSLGVALDYLAEVSEQILPEHEPNDRFFRLLLLALDHLRACGAAGLWRVVTYFSLWAVKLGGWLPDLDACTGCGVDIPPGERAYFARSLPGLACERCRPSAGWALSPDSRRLAAEMLEASLRKLAPRAWDKKTAADLRQFLVQRLEENMERKLVTAPMLAEL